ncbi:MAG TPA: glycosyltransferase [Candidatus Paceibacterota bacterium]|nr:glycosyltransferase [Candidatus Paceibacterota bacterium]
MSQYPSKNKNILFAVSSLGLGHATRTLPIIRDFELRGFRIFILSDGKALEYLKQEFPTARFITSKDYPPLERGKDLQYYLYICPDLFRTIFTVRREHAETEKIITDANICAIFSDGRYGVYSRRIPSFFLTHQTQFHVRPRDVWFTPVLHFFNYSRLKKFDHIFIPDYEDERVSLAGKLSRAHFLKKLPHSYIGTLSSLRRQNGISEDIDYLFTISGFLDEHRPSFIKTLLEQARELPGKKVFVLGNPASSEVHHDPEANITIYENVSGEKRNELFNRARFVVSRCGYTTLMDMAELEKPSLLIPTPNQREQEYLALWNAEKRIFLTEEGEEQISLAQQITRVQELLPFPSSVKTHHALEHIRRTMQNIADNRFGDIV